MIIKGMKHSALELISSLDNKLGKRRENIYAAWLERVFNKKEIIKICLKRVSPLNSKKGCS
jgi:hypothetical protein